MEFFDEEDDDADGAGDENPKDIPWFGSSKSPSSGTSTSSSSVVMPDEEDDAGDLDGVEDCSIAFVKAAMWSGDSMDTAHEEMLWSLSSC